MKKIYFKTPNLSDEWVQLLLKNPKLVFLVLSFAQRIDENITLTEILRTSEEQHTFYPTQPTLVSVHQVWRGVDISVKSLNLIKVNKIVSDLNVEFPYGKNGTYSFLVHDSGHGLHLHVQTIG